MDNDCEVIQLLYQEKQYGYIYLENCSRITDEDKDLIYNFAKLISAFIYYRFSKQRSDKPFLFETVANNIPNSYISVISKELTVIFSSGEEFKNQGLDPDAFLGLSIKEIFGDKADVVKEYYLKTFAGEKQTFDLFINNQYQRYRTVPLKGKDATIDNILVVVENITEFRHTKDNLQYSETTLNAFVEQSKDAIILLNKEGDILMWNQAQEDLSGYTFSEVKNGKL